MHDGHASLPARGAGGRWRRWGRRASPSGCARCRSWRPAAGSRRSPSRGWRACRHACRRRASPALGGVDQRDAGGVVAAVFQPAQSLDHDVLRLLLPDVSHDSAHEPESTQRTARSPEALPVQQSSTCRTPQGWPSRASPPPTWSSIAAAWAALARETKSPLTPDEVRQPARPGRRARPPRGRAGLSPPVPPALQVRRGREPAAPGAGGVPAPPAAATHAVRDRPRRVGRGRQVDHGSRPPADAGALARAPQRRAGDDRRLPLPQRRARAARDPAPQGVPRVLRPQGAAAVRHRHQVRARRGRGTDVLPPRLRRRPRREGRDQATRHRDHRGPQRPPARTHPRRRSRGPRGQRLLRLLRVRRRCAGRHQEVVHRALPAAARDGVRRPGVVLLEVRTSSRTSRRSRWPRTSGTRSTAPT